MNLFLMTELIIVLAVSILVIIVFHRLKIPVVVGFLITGIIIGPGGLGLIKDLKAINALAEVGVMMLLFIIGIEFSLERLQKIQKYFWIGGGLQVSLTIAIAAAIFVWLGFGANEGIFYGFLVAQSSTSVLLKILSDKNLIKSPVGEVSMGISLFNDVALLPMLFLVPALAELKTISVLNLSVRLAISIIAILAVFFVTRKIMPPIIEAIVRTRIKEIFLILTLLVCLGMSYLTASVGFSLALGAFLAGIILSESSYSHQIVSDILPFRDVFSSIFFISVGMLLDTRLVWGLRRPVLLVVIGILLIKGLVVIFTVRLLKFNFKISLLSAFGLAQIGEISFVLATVGRENGLISWQVFQVFIASSIITLVVAPLLMEFGPKLVDKLSDRLEMEKEIKSMVPEKKSFQEHVIIAGFGLNGQNLARVLKETGIPYVILEINPDTYRRVDQAGEPIIFGDASSSIILREAGIARARVLVLALNDPGAARRAVCLARQLNREIFIIVRTRFASEIEELYALGASDVIPEEFETSIEIFVRVLEKFHLPRNIINTQVQIIRSEHYGLLRGARSSSRRLDQKIYDFLEAGLVETFLVTEDAWTAGKTLGEIDLRSKTGVTVIAVVRNEKTWSGPGGDFRLQGQDILVLVGNHQAIDQALAYLSDSGL
ncbi:MAG: cation:proton antiporter [Acidobacteriota bacterium]|nr:cation:proton antiporter [Acidobacteriota bacterium]